MEKVFDTAEYWNRRYLTYGPHAAGSIKKESLKDPHRVMVKFESRYREALKSVFPNKVGRLLYFGCGSGRFVPLVMEFGEKIVGIDVSGVALNYFREEHTHLFEDGTVGVFHYNEGEALPFGEEFDAVLVFNAFCSVREDLLDYYVEELKRVVKHGGVVACIEKTYERGAIPRIERRAHMTYLLRSRVIVNWGFETSSVDGFFTWSKDGTWRAGHR